MSDPLWINTAADVTVGTATIEADNDLFTIVGHQLVNGDRVVVSNLTGGAVGVLAENGIYWVRDVATDVFSVALTRAGLPIDFSVDGGADVERFQPAYHAAELRRAFSGLMYQAGTLDRFGAREGILPTQSLSAILLSGSTWTVLDINAFVYPGISNNDGPYVIQHPEESGSLNPADGSNDRIDALDLQIQDHDEDASGQRRARIVYVVGTPDLSPVAPPLTANSFRLAAILVPAGGSPPPSVQTEALMTAAAGGAIVVRDDTELPVNPTDGNLAFQLDTSSLRVRHASAWQTLGSTHGYQFGGRVIYTSSGSFSKGNFPGLRAIDVLGIGGGGGAGGCQSTGSGEGSEGAGGGGGSGFKAFIQVSDLADTETVTVGGGGNGGSSGPNQGADGGTTTFTVTGGTNLVAEGGGGGAGGTAQGQSGNTVATGGFPTFASGGDINVQGNKGGNGVVMKGETVKLNYGGASAFGYGSNAGSAAFSSAGAAGDPAGGGAGGPRNNDNDSGRAGQDGARGLVVVKLYY